MVSFLKADTTFAVQRYEITAIYQHPHIFLRFLVHLLSPSSPLLSHHYNLRAEAILNLTRYAYRTLRSLATETSSALDLSLSII